MIQPTASAGAESIRRHGLLAPQPVASKSAFSLFTPHGLPAPPREVLADLDRAQGSLQELRQQGLRASLQFGADGRLSVEVRDAEDRVVGTLGATEALDALATGQSLIDQSESRGK